MDVNRIKITSITFAQLFTVIYSYLLNPFTWISGRYLMNISSQTKGK
jgi:hypothetical protein